MKKLAIILWGALFISIGGFFAWTVFLVSVGIIGFIWLLRIWVCLNMFKL